MLFIVRQASICGESQKDRVYVAGSNPQHDVYRRQRTGTDIRMATQRTKTSTQRHFPHFQQRKNESFTGTNGRAMYDTASVSCAL